MWILRHPYAAALCLWSTYLTAKFGLNAYGPRMFLPDFDNYLRAQDLDPSLLEGKSDLRVYVNDGTGLYPALSEIFNRTKNPFSSAMVRTTNGDCVIRLGHIFLRSADYNLTEKEKKLFDVFHEYRHCQIDNFILPLAVLKEKDADIYALKNAEAFNLSPSLPQAVITERALQDIDISPLHFTVLFVDAWLNGQPEPTVDAAAASERWLYLLGETAFLDYLLTTGYCHEKDHAGKSQRDTLVGYKLEMANAQSDLPPLTQRRIALRHDALIFTNPALAQEAEDTLRKITQPCPVKRALQ